MYRIPRAPTGRRETDARRALEGRPLRFATVAINQCSGRSWRKPDVRPLFKRITGFERRTNRTAENQRIELTLAVAARQGPRGHEFGDHAAVRCNGDALPASLRRT